MRTIFGFSTLIVSLAALSTMQAAASDRAFFRISAESNTAFHSISADGSVAWSNAITPDNCLIEIAEDLSATNSWRPYLLAAVTGTIHSVQLFDLEAPPGMAFIPEGPFAMGNSFTDYDCGSGGEIVEFPQHTVTVSKFYIETHEVTRELWALVQDWSLTNGYDFSAGAGDNPNGPQHPAGGVSWYDCVKWCNARSEMEGLTPCYYTAANQSNVYRSGGLNISNNWVKWTVDGYRLPTEAEWEKACRGGVIGSRFPWGDTITHSNANYCSYEYFSTNTYTNAPLCFYDLSPTRGYHPSYSNSTPSTAPAGSFAPNGYGLYDVSGNVNEWCWDWYGKFYYSTSTNLDPRGPSSAPAEPGGTNRILRGGGWYSWDASLHRCAYRMGNPPQEKTDNRGLRCVRSSIQ